jgi:hypothetical protein
MGSLAELNNKWLYRLLKVIFSLIFICVLIALPTWIYFSSDIIYVKDYQASCYYGNSSSFSLKNKGIDINWDLNGAVPKVVDSQILKYCGITSDIKTQIENNNAASCAENKSLATGWLKEIGCYGHTLYGVEQKSVPKDVKLNAFFKALVTAIVIFLIFEIIRRIFYYIYFGKIRP